MDQVTRNCCNGLITKARPAAEFTHSLLWQGTPSFCNDHTQRQILLFGDMVRLPAAGVTPILCIQSHVMH